MMNGKELITMAEIVSREKQLSKGQVLQALADGLATAIKRGYPLGAKVEVNIDSDTGEISAQRVYDIVDAVEFDEYQIQRNQEHSGEIYREPIEVNLNRQQFNITKQVALQKMRNEEKEEYVEHLLEKDNLLFMGVVKGMRKDAIIVEMNKIEVQIPKSNLMPKDRFKKDDKIYFVIEKTENKNNYTVIGSRISKEFVLEALKREIPQVEDGDIEVVKIARIPGYKTKVVVYSNTLPAIKYCVGAKAQHVKNLNEFLQGEHIDFIEYNEEPAQLLISSIAPIEPNRISIDEETNTIDVCVDDMALELAQGKNNSNIRLLEEIVGCNVRILSNSQWEEAENNAYADSVVNFMMALALSEDDAHSIVSAGYNEIEEIAYLPIDEIEIEGFDDEKISNIRLAARNYLSLKEITKSQSEHQELEVIGLNQSEIDQLQKNGIKNKADVAELSTYDLQDILVDLPDYRAKTIILRSRDLM